MKKLFILFLLTINGSLAFSQSRKLDNYKSKADQEFNLFRYNLAAQLYLKSDTTNVEVISQLAKSYIKLRYYTQAHHWLQKQAVFENQPAQFYLDFAEILANVQDYEQSEKYYQKFLTFKEGDKRASLQSKAFGQLHLMLQDSVKWNVSYLTLNTPMDEFAPQYFKNGLVFTSNRDNKAGIKNMFGWTETPFTNLFLIEDSSTIKHVAPQNYFYNTSDLIIKEYDQRLKPKTIHDNRVLGTVEYAASLVNNALFYDSAEVRLLDKALTSPLHDGPITFNRAQDFYFFNRNKDKKTPTIEDVNAFQLDLYWGIYAGGRWHSVTPFQHNDPNYSTAHPALSADGNTLYFVSDKPGGYGGKDLYFSTRSGNNWSEPKNMGPTINTEGDETFPYIHENGAFYFSSNGHTGLGGLDLFTVQLKENVPTGAIQNLGYPINSSKDDFAFISDVKNTSGYFSSNRYGSDDIFRYTRNPIVVKVEGKVLANLQGAKTALNNALVTLNYGSRTDSVYTNSIGFYSFDLTVNTPYTLTVTTDQYEEILKESISTVGITQSTTLQNDFEFVPPVVAKTALNDCDVAKVRLQINNIYYDLDKFNIRSDAEKTLQKLLVILKDFPELELKIKSHTDSRASAEYNMRLSNNRANAVIDWLTARGISKSRLTGEYFGKRIIVNGCGDGVDCSEDVHQVNRRSEFYFFYQGKNLTIDCGIILDATPQVHVIPVPPTTPSGKCSYAKEDVNLDNIFYDLDKSNIREDALPAMNKLLGVLNKYPELHLQIKSHTDSRASAAYNLQLSKRRAQSVIDWLVARGINKARLSGDYFGKRLLVNNCGDGVECDEDVHQINRRSEFYLFLNDKNITIDCQ